MVAALYVRSDSIYKSMGCDAWDIERDARKYNGPFPVIAHPPCGSWGRLRMVSKASQTEKDCAIIAVSQVRRFGGVLEHPEGSTLWKSLGLPKGNEVDKFGGWTLSVDQHWWGHKARKRTWLYIVGISQRDIPPFSPSFTTPTHVIERSQRMRKKNIRKLVLPHGLRNSTPPQFAAWLIELASSCRIGLSYLPQLGRHHQTNGIPATYTDGHYFERF